MFPRERRLRHKRDITAVLKRGRMFRHPFLMLRVLPTARAYPRVTVVVGTVVSKRATVRNRVKRQLRHIMRSELKRVPAGVDLMVSVRPLLLKATVVERRAALHDLLWRARVVSERNSKFQSSNVKSIIK